MADGTEPDPVEALLESGRKLLAEARKTMADLDAMTNTAVVPIVVPDGVLAAE